MFVLKLISFFPLWLLYLIADFLYFIAYHLTKYRRNVVVGNLQKAFPEKAEGELRLIEKQFYRSLTDFAVETVKSHSMSPKQFKKRVIFKNLELLQKYKGKPIMFMASHQFNWEWMQLSAALQFPFEIDYIYQPLKLKSFDRYMIKLRSRFGAQPINRHNAAREIIKSSKKGRGFAMVADQVPGRNVRIYWTQFLNQETAYFMGTEALAKLIKCPVVYFAIQKIKRGYYEVDIVEIAEPPYQKEDHSILENYSKATEQNIRKHPSQWLWSHKRWKYTKAEAEASKVI